MRRLVTLILLLVLHISVYGDERGSELLRQLSDRVVSMGRYRVEFLMSVESDPQSIKGEYVVDAERYMLSVAGSRIYGDRSLRMTIDAVNEEVVKEYIEPYMPMIIANPASAFVGLDKYFDAVVGEHSAAQVTISLQPKQEQDLFESSTLVLDAVSYLPLSVSYVAQGERVEVQVLSFERSNEQIPAMDAISYPVGYEFIDLSN